MTTKLTATILAGVLKPDRPLLLPESTRVMVTIAPVPDSTQTAQAWDSFKCWIGQNLVHGIGPLLTRDELHERD